MTTPFTCPVCDADKPCSVECAKHAERRAKQVRDLPPYEVDRLPEERQQ